MASDVSSVAMFENNSRLLHVVSISIFHKPQSQKAISSLSVLDYPEWELSSYQLSMFEKLLQSFSFGPHRHICVLRHPKYWYFGKYMFNISI